MNQPKLRLLLSKTQKIIPSLAFYENKKTGECVAGYQIEHYLKFSDLTLPVDEEIFNQAEVGKQYDLFI